MSETPRKIYRIACWADLYETSETRKYVALRWVPVPNKHDGLGYRRMVSNRERCQLFSAWLLIVQVASKGRPEQRGWLVRDGKPLDAEDLELITGFPAQIFAAAFIFFSDSKIGWLIADDSADMPAAPAGNGLRPVAPPDSPAPPAVSPASSAGAPGESPVEGKEEKERMEGKKKAAPPARDESEDEWMERLQATHAGIDVRAQLVDAQKNRDKQGKPLERAWFEAQWLPRCSPAVAGTRRRAAAAEPTGWREWLKVAYPGGEIPSAFGLLPASVQKECRVSMRGNSGNSGKAA
jgi:hypothetical protein